jgi:ABC-type nitrate/sulfonate/bicarbonate transport system ATPase subunit
LKGATCQKADCLYLHEPGDPLASFTKEQMQQGYKTIVMKNKNTILLII